MKFKGMIAIGNLAVLDSGETPVLALEADIHEHFKKVEALFQSLAKKEHKVDSFGYRLENISFGKEKLSSAAKKELGKYSSKFAHIPEVSCNTSVL